MKSTPIHMNKRSPLAATPSPIWMYEHPRLRNRHHGRRQRHAAQKQAPQSPPRDRWPRLLLHVIAAAKTIVPADHIYCIIGHEADLVKSAVTHTGVAFVLQAEQRGTGHALQMLKADFELSGATPPENLLVLSGDVPLIRPETIAAVRDAHLREHAAMTILTAVPDNPHGYGRVLRLREDAPEVTAIVEQKSLTPEQLGAREINSGIYCFQTKRSSASSIPSPQTTRRASSTSPMSPPCS